MTVYSDITTGDAGLWFHQRSYANPDYAIDAAAGRYIVLCFFGSAGDTDTRAALRAAGAAGDVFDDRKCSFFGVSNDPADESGKRVANHYPGFRYLWDFDGSVSRLYGALPRDSEGIDRSALRKRWVVLDPTTRILRILPFGDAAAAIAYLRELPPASNYAGFEISAPILVLPHVFEPEFCSRLIGLYDEHGGVSSGFMRDVGGKTVHLTDEKHKVRRDYKIEDENLIGQIQLRFRRRVVPEIEKIHCFKVTRMERYIVACYSADEKGHFRAHRDNRTKGTAHRRYAASINLNADFEGGEIQFPEYGQRTYKPPVGGAVVFSCSMLHAVTQVTAGRRYAFLPFLYDNAAAQIRAENMKYLETGEKKSEPA